MPERAYSCEQSSIDVWAASTRASSEPNPPDRWMREKKVQGERGRHSCTPHHSTLSSRQQREKSTDGWRGNRDGRQQQFQRVSMRFGRGAAGGATVIEARSEGRGTEQSQCGPARSAHLLSLFAQLSSLCVLVSSPPPALGDSRFAALLPTVSQQRENSHTTAATSQVSARRRANKRQRRTPSKQQRAACERRGGTTAQP